MNLAQSYTEEVRKTIPFQQNTLARQYTKREKRNSILNIVCWKCCMIKIIILIGKNVIYLQYHFKSIFWSKDIPKKKNETKSILNIFYWKFYEIKRIILIVKYIHLGTFLGSVLGVNAFWACSIRSVLKKAWSIRSVLKLT